MNFLYSKWVQLTLVVSSAIAWIVVWWTNRKLRAERRDRVLAEVDTVRANAKSKEEAEKAAALKKANETIKNLKTEVNNASNNIDLADYINTRR